MSARLYRTDFPHQCRTHPIDGMVLVFHRPSGMTHFLDTPAPEILALLAERPMDAGGLAAALSAQAGVEPDDEVLTVVEARLNELVASGLVQTG